MACPRNCSPCGTPAFCSRSSTSTPSYTSDFFECALSTCSVLRGMPLRSAAVKSRGVVTAPLILKSEGPLEGFGGAACCAHAESPSKKGRATASRIRRMGIPFQYESNETLQQRHKLRKKYF